MIFLVLNVRLLNMVVYIIIFLWSLFLVLDFFLVNEEDYSIIEMYFGLNGVIYVKIFFYYLCMYFICC